MRPILVSQSAFFRFSCRPQSDFLHFLRHTILVPKVFCFMYVLELMRGLSLPALGHITQRWG